MSFFKLLENLGKSEDTESSKKDNKTLFDGTSPKKRQNVVVDRDITCKEYAPDVFEHLRHKDSIQRDDLI